MLDIQDVFLVGDFDKKGFGFRIVTSAREYNLVAETIQERERWVAALLGFAERHKKRAAEDASKVSV